MLTRALVLGGGGSMGIGWETGYLEGLADGGVDTRIADLIVGTSAGSQVGTLVASNLSWNDIWERLIDPKHQQIEESPSSNLGPVFERYDEIAASSKTPHEWIERIGELAIETKIIPESNQLSRIENKITGLHWAESLRIAAIDLATSERVVWGPNSGVELLRAVAASSSLPGVWPPTTIGSRKYFDGGAHSMENADVAEGANKVLILSVGLPVKTPYTLEGQIRNLQESGSEVELIKPDKNTYSALQKLGGNPVDPKIRPVIAACAREQGRKDAERLASFWNQA
ncbi:patatin-like phospholipase family protein [Clostridium folliculivorans]|nr:patatin-like phospholipase family protein [Clostridium folliculivorans]